ncbi:MAG: glycogen debranching protein GlgX [Nostoc sp.]|uniref:glycogen debranching protein GlgX n=1 Tax=Nostoc sp. TaxID=1180 RepID=UPI002FF6EC19
MSIFTKMLPDILPGQPFPIGATFTPNGVNFSVFSKSCTGLELLLFDEPNSPQPSRAIQLHKKHNKTFYYWHILVSDIAAGQVYAYRADGLYAPDQGLRFDSSKVLLDPYARAVVGWDNYSREAASCFGKDNCAQALRAVVADDPKTYDWEGDLPLRIPYATTVIYELHVDGFTHHPSSGVSPEKRGKYAGLIEKIPYLQELGITAVELLPIHQFDPNDARPSHKNYWGYSTISFFAPHSHYSSRSDRLDPINEFRDLVKALHRAGIEVILDVVFNHTAEGNHNGPTLSFKGLDNQAYYLLEPNQAEYSNYSGCGNTLKANHPMVTRMILDSLYYWVAEMHVDGFRFDLASVLSRSKLGQPFADSPVLWAIETDPVLAGTKVIAEAWDASGLYQVGKFVAGSDRFAEWNGPYRDDVRCFVKGDRGIVSRLAARVMGSPDIYSRPDYEPNHSINFITCHDGFTLNDLVSYNYKYNEANGENNSDGTNDNNSWNCGVEGVTEDAEIEILRLRQIKNFFTILLCSQGTPMLLMGDEIRREQKGNNNGYCQDNELSWFDWSSIEEHKDLLRFVRGLIQFIQSLRIFRQEKVLSLTDGSHRPNIVWHGTKLEQPDWGNDSHSLAFTLRHPKFNEHLYIILNAYWQPLTFELPLLSSGEGWHQIVDTALRSPQDFSDLKTAPLITSLEYLAGGRSVVVLMAG